MDPTLAPQPRGRGELPGPCYFPPPHSCATFEAKHGQMSTPFITGPGGDADDASMTEQEAADMAFLRDKRALLANPGIKLDDVYYSALNTTVELAEVTYNFGRFNQSLSNSQFGGQSQIVIPNSSLVSTVYLYLQLPALVANQTLPRGWGYMALATINYLLGSSNVSLVQLLGQNVLQVLMAQCDTDSKRSDILRYGGEETFGPTTGPVECCLVLPFPWSTIGGEYPKRPYDSRLLENPITLQIGFNLAGQIYGGSGARPVGFNQARLLVKQGDFAQPSQSLATALRLHPEMHYCYPFTYQQTGQIYNFTTSSGVVNSANLLGFINGDLVGMTIGVVAQTDLLPLANNTPNAFNYQTLQDVTLTFNGQVMYFAPGQVCQKIFATDGELTSGKFSNSIVNPGAVAPFTSFPADTYVLYIDFSRVRTASFEDHYPNVWRIGTNTMVLTFSLPNAPVAPATTNYSLYATYYYNGCFLTQNGVSRAYFD